MKITARMVAIAVTAGIAGVGALALMTPAVADVVTHPMAWAADGTGHGRGMGNGDGTGPGAGMRNSDGTGPGAGMGRGAGMRNGDGTAGGVCTITAEQGTMTDSQRSALAALAQEEKLANNLYVAFADKYDVTVFSRIAMAEEHHLATLRTLMSRYAVTDPTAGQPAGKFTDATVQATYDRLLSDGSKDVKAAYAVGRTVEQTDIDDLQRALSGLTAPDAKQVYTNLTAASRQHLSVFDAWSKR